MKVKMWKWPGEAGWHFVTLEKNLAEKIRNVYTKGMVKIKAKVGKTSWDTALFPHKLSKSYLLPMKKNVRLKEDIWEGDVLEINFKIK